MATWDPNTDFAKAMSEATSTRELRKLAAQRDAKIKSQYDAGTYDKSTTPSTLSLYQANKARIGSTGGSTGSSGSGRRSSSGDLGGGSSGTGSLQQQIADAQKQQAVNAFRSAFESTRRGLSQQQADLQKAYRQQEVDIGTQDVMARKALENRLAQQGLSASGAVGQGEIAQNVLTQGALTSSREQQSLAERDIANQLAEAQRQRDLGIATAESEANIAMLQQQLQNMEAQKAQERQDVLNTLGAYSVDYQARINELQNDGDTSNDWQIPYLQQARQEKIASLNLDQQGNALPTVTTLTPSQALSLWKTTEVASQEIADALGSGVNLGDRYSSGITGAGGGITEPTLDDGEVNTQEERLGYQALAERVASSPFYQRMSPNELAVYLQQMAPTFSGEYTSDAINQFINETASIMPTVQEEPAQKEIRETGMDLLTSGEKTSISNNFTVNGQIVDVAGMMEYLAGRGYDNDQIASILFDYGIE